MKKYSIQLITILALFTCMLEGCKIESEIYDKINPGVFPQNEEDVKALVSSSTYHVFSPWRIFAIATGYTIVSDIVTDHVENTWGWTTLYNSYEANDWHIDGDDRRNYDYISYLSAMTLCIDRIKDVGIHEELLERYIAEVKCGMGFLSFLLYDLYGPIPIPDLEILKDPLNEQILPRLSEEEMQQYIETHLLEAAEVLPYKYDAANYGRFTKGLANTLLLKFYMLTRQWDKAEAVGRELTRAEYGYELVPDYHSLFTLEGEINSETIFSSIAKAGVMEGQWHAHVLTADFPTPGDKTITKWGGYKITWPFYESYEANDKRKEKIYGEYTGTEGVEHSRLLDRDSGTQGLLYRGAVPVKYGFDGVVGEKCEIDMPIYRYADVITLLAEAIVRNGNQVTTEALNYLNQVRNRAGLPSYTFNEVNNVETFLDKILLERGHEFYLEGVRRQDLIRHGKFIEYAIQKAEFAGEPTAKIATQVDGVYKYERFPIPTKVIAEGKGIIKQNPGF
ncbi:MAG: RagB/SusD family nutrient uptake outer membrane protein [Tannerellaceae bacterium]|nr:RagB/SusD family nutrient uptake outer membrane protein [Tannerellaceae bacterium]